MKAKTPNFIAQLKTLLDSLKADWRSDDQIHGMYQDLIKSHTPPTETVTKGEIINDLYTKLRHTGKLTSGDCVEVAEMCAKYIQDRLSQPQTYEDFENRAIMIRQTDNLPSAIRYLKSFVFRLPGRKSKKNFYSDPPDCSEYKMGDESKIVKKKN